MERQESEKMGARVEADVALIFPLLGDEVDGKLLDGSLGEDAHIWIDYPTITNLINDYVERYTIDARIDSVDLHLSTPQLEDQNATENLKEATTGESQIIETEEGSVKVNNDAITDDKVTLTFELSIEENVYLDEQLPQSQDSSKKSISSGVNQSDNSATLPGSDLIITSKEPELYWQASPKSELYIQNIPTTEDTPTFTEALVDVTTETTDTIGKSLSGTEQGLSASVKLRKDLDLKVGSNGKVYQNFNGNGKVKIIGKVSNNPVVKKAGMVGTAISIASDMPEVVSDYKAAKTDQERGKVVGAEVGKVTASTVAGMAGASVGTLLGTAAVSILIGAGLTVTAPVSLVIVGGCAIVGAAYASSASESKGKEIGGKAGEGVVNTWKSWTQPKPIAK
ncbi:MAG: hypothetical protein LIO91_00795 [Bacteroidales bacterium]|nr:hypothetical protein [Bacteroidales bacterium]